LIQIYNPCDVGQIQITKIYCEIREKKKKEKEVKRGEIKKQQKREKTGKIREKKKLREK
jgi:hypothetical protein